MFKRIYFAVLRDIYAGLAMNALMQMDIRSVKAKEGETVGEVLARYSYERADNLIKHRTANDHPTQAKP